MDDVAHGPHFCSDSDGYDMDDLYLHWRSGRSSVHGIQDIDLPQFSVVEYRTVEKIESLLTGARTDSPNSLYSYRTVYTTLRNYS